MPDHAGPLRIDVKLEKQCARPGDLQTIVISTDPKAGVVYDAVYANGKYGASKDYYGGNNGGQTDGNGTWRDSWTIGAGAPRGPVRVDVLGITRKGRGYAAAWFAIGDASGRCA